MFTGSGLVSIVADNKAVGNPEQVPAVDSTRPCGSGHRLRADFTPSVRLGELVVGSVTRWPRERLLALRDQALQAAQAVTLKPFY